MSYADPDRQREYMRKWIAKRRAEWFADKYCVQCGNTENLELDHIDPGSKVDHRIWSWSEARRTVELAKCQVLCRSCHLMKSCQQDNANYVNGFKHGSRSMYQKHRCRCELCSDWQSRRMKRWREKQAVIAQVA